MPHNVMQQPPKVPAATLLGVTAWRLIIVACGVIGFATAVGRYGFGNAIPGLSQQASALVAVVYLGLALYPLVVSARAHEPRSPWWRGAMAVLLLLVSVTFGTLMSGEYDAPDLLFEHLLTPLVVLIDWVAVGRNQAATRWWHPLTWLAFPAAYLGYFVLADPGLYGGFLDPQDSSFGPTVAGFLVAVLLAGYALYGIAKLKTLIAAQSRRQQPPQPQWQPPPSQPQHPLHQPQHPPQQRPR